MDKKVSVDEVTLAQVEGLATQATVDTEVKPTEGLVEEVQNLEKLTKEELIGLVKMLTSQNKTLSNAVKDNADERDKIVSDMNSHYSEVIRQKNTYIKYLLNKIKLIKDLITLEEEAEK